MIDKIIHFMNKHGYSSMNENEKKCINTFKNLNKDYQIIIWSNVEIDNLIKKHFKEDYNTWKNNIYGYRGNLKKWDTTRLCILYIFGGFYSDNDCTNLLNLDNLLNYELVIKKPVYRWSESYKKFSKETLLHSCNAFIGSEKNNIHIKNIITKIFNNYNIDKHMHVGKATGCLLLGDYINKNLKNKDNIYLLDYFEFKEGPEYFDWIDIQLYKKLYVVHKINDKFNPGRYLCFKNNKKI